MMHLSPMQTQIQLLSAVENFYTVVVISYQKSLAKIRHEGTKVSYAYARELKTIHLI